MTAPEGEPEGQDVADFDIGAVYARYRDLMYRVAYVQLQPSGRTSEAGDVVQDVIVSLMRSRPRDVQNWEAFLVRAVKNKVLDLLRSAAAIHDGGMLDEAYGEVSDGSDFSEDVADELDRQAQAGIAWDCLSILTQQERTVVWDVVALERPRKDVAAELDVTPPRVTQIKNQSLRKLEEEMRRREADHV